MDNTTHDAPQSGEAPKKMEPKPDSGQPPGTTPAPTADPTTKEVAGASPAPRPGGGDPALKGYDPPDDPPAEGPVPHNGIKRADLPWQVVQLSESLPLDVTLVAYFMIGADHVLVTNKGHYGLHEGSLSQLKMYVLY